MDLQHSLRAHPYILRSGLTLQVLGDIPGIAQAAVITGIYSKYHTNTAPVRYWKTALNCLSMQYHTTIVLHWYRATRRGWAHKNISPRTDSLTFAPRTALIRHPTSTPTQYPRETTAWATLPYSQRHHYIGRSMEYRRSTTPAWYHTGTARKDGLAWLSPLSGAHMIHRLSTTLVPQEKTV
jgi:hypothetical protein